MAATAGDAGSVRGSRARLPTQGRGEVLLLLGPCAVYLAVFSIFPLITSLVRSFQDYNTRTDTWRWVGLQNYSELVHSSDFWTVVENTVVLTLFQKRLGNRAAGIICSTLTASGRLAL